jgi:hypothetical protein
LTSSNRDCRAFTRDELLELRRERANEPKPKLAFPHLGKGAEVQTLHPKPEVSVAVAAPIEEIEILNQEIAPSLCAPGVGAEFNAAVARTMQERGFLAPALPLLPLAPPCLTPVLIRGPCTRVEIDEMRTLVAHNAIVWDALPPILLRHGEPCGECLSLEYSPMGDTLTLTARIDLEEARRMPALSVNVVPLAYAFVDGPYWHWRITKARLVEISVTDKPCLRSALITARTAAAAPIEDPRYRAIQNQLARLKLALAA